MSKDRDQRYNELLILKTIAETLNQSSDIDQMLQSTLQKLLEVTGLATGWQNKWCIIFFMLTKAERFLYSINYQLNYLHFASIIPR